MQPVKKYCVCNPMYFGNMCLSKLPDLKITPEVVLFSKLVFIKAPLEALKSGLPSTTCTECPFNGIF